MRITDILEAARKRGEPVFTFEFFPPKTEEGERALMETIAALRPLQPAWVSVTYGAGGSTRAKTVELVRRLKRESGIEPMAHVTCVGASRAEVAALLDEVAAAGVENVLALRGDPPRGEATFRPHPGRLPLRERAGRLHPERPAAVALLRRRGRLPRGAPGDARPGAADLRHLKAKVDAGTDFLVTQLFFDNGACAGFVERARAAGIRVPIVPGIMPFTSVEQVERFTATCGATIPRAAPRGDGGAPERSGRRPRSWGSPTPASSARTCSAPACPGIHFYTLNRSPSTRAIVAALLAAEPWRRTVRLP